MIVIDVFDLMADYRRELVFTVHQSEQALAYIDVSARHGEGIDEIAFRNIVESVRQPPMRMGRNTRSYSAEVALDFGSVAVLLGSRKTVRSRGLRRHTSTSRILPTQSKSKPRPDSRKLRSLTHNANIKIATPSSPHESVIKPCLISRASNTVRRPIATKKITCSGRHAKVCSIRTIPDSKLPSPFLLNLNANGKAANSSATTAPTLTMRLSHKGAGKYVR